MTREFSDGERERIRERLLETAREQFARHGIERTRIADLTDPVDIAPSTFYTFFDSKEDCYVKVLESQAEEVAARIIGSSFEAHDDPEAAIRAFLTAVCAEIESNPLTRRLIAEGEVERLEAGLDEDELEQSRREDVAYFLPYVVEYFEAGRLRGPGPETVAHAVRAVTFLTLHREDVGEDRYPAVRDLVIEAFAAGLVTE